MMTFKKVLFAILTTLTTFNCISCVEDNSAELDALNQQLETIESIQKQLDIIMSQINDIPTDTNKKSDSDDSSEFVEFKSKLIHRDLSGSAIFRYKDDEIADMIEIVHSVKSSELAEVLDISEVCFKVDDCSGFVYLDTHTTSEIDVFTKDEVNFTYRDYWECHRDVCRRKQEIYNVPGYNIEVITAIQTVLKDNMTKTINRSPHHIDYTFTGDNWADTVGSFDITYQDILDYLQ